MSNQFFPNFLSFRSLTAIFLACASFASAQAPARPPASIEPPPTPDQVATARQLPLNPALPTLFIVGDSTARNQADLGWGDHFARYVDLARVNVANRAIAGRSSRTFIREGAWSRLLAEVKKGDFVLIQMGHNDGGALDGPKPRGTLKGLGDETREVTLPSGEKEIVHTYGWYIRKFIADARAKGATPFLLTLTVRNIWSQGSDGKPHIERDMGYGDWLRQLAASERVPLLDMALLEADLLENLGAERTAKLFPVDHTHTSPQGAEINALCVANAILHSGSTLRQFLRTPLPALGENAGNQ